MQPMKTILACLFSLVLLDAAVAQVPGTETTTAPVEANEPLSPAVRRAEELRRQRVTPVVRAYRKARPAVVNISSQRLVAGGLSPFGRDPFDDIFPIPGLTRRVPVQSLGSGVVIHPDGYVATNAHVVRRAHKVTVTLNDGEKFEAKVLSAAPEIDLAVLKIDLPEGRTLQHLPMGRSDDLMVGETVIAIGNPLGLANTLTTGVISALKRNLDFPQGRGRRIRIAGLVQTDAPINPGNSGGPLLNIHGQWIGINTAIRADAQNIGFAIPIDRLAAELTDLMDFERINRVVFGARVVHKVLPDGPAAYVLSVREGTPAAGVLVPGDRILAVDGNDLASVAGFACTMVQRQAGDAVGLRVRRNGDTQDVRIELAAKPKPDGAKLARRLWGVKLREITPDLAEALNLPAERGLLVVGIEAGSPADRVGLRLKDLLFQVGRLYVKDLDDLGLVLEDLQPGEALRIGIVRGNVRAWADLVARKPVEE